jgi:hypothetical protein
MDKINNTHMKNTLNLDHPLTVLKKNEEVLMKRIRTMVDSDHKWKVEAKLRGIRAVIAIVKQANLELESGWAE